MFCTSCGNQIREVARFCKYCGKSVVDNSNEISYNYNNNYRNDQYVNTNSSGSKSIGIICGIFVPILIAVFIGLIYNNSIERKNYYKYLGITYLIKIMIVVFFFIILIIIIIRYMPYQDTYETIVKFNNFTRLILN